MTIALQRSAGNRAVRAMIARMPLLYIPDRSKPSDKVKTTTTKMTDVQLQDVIAHPGDPYMASEVTACKEELAKRHSPPPAKTTGKTPKKAPPDQAAVTHAQAVLKPTIEAIDKKAIAIVDELNEPTTTDEDFETLFTALKKLKGDVFADFNKAATGQKVDQDALELVRAELTSRLGQAISRVGFVLKNVSASETRQDLLAKEAVVYPGAKTLVVMHYDVPTSESTAELSRAGLQALKAAPFKLTDPELHHVVNALRKGYKLSADSNNLVERWLKKLDEMAPLWPKVKAESAEKWVRKYLLPKSSELWANYKGAYGELWETHRIVSSGELASGTQIRMGKDKVRPEAPGMKQQAKPTTTQDIDLSFHGAEGKRHYHEIKADADTIVNKIGIDEAKTAMVQGPTGPPDPALAATPDQVLSYASTRAAHQAKPSKKGRYATGKQIVLVYAAPYTRNWLRIFTSKAGRRLIAHGFELRLGEQYFDATLLTRVQAKVDADAPPADPARDDWAVKESAVDPKQYVAKL